MAAAIQQLSASVAAGSGHASVASRWGKRQKKETIFRFFVIFIIIQASEQI